MNAEIFSVVLITKSHIQPSIFRPSRIIRTRPPFEVERTLHSPFAISAHVILKAGYSWLSANAANSPDGAVNGMLLLDWMLDLTSHAGRGSMGRIRLKVMKEGAEIGDGHDQDLEDRELRRDRDAWERMVREYQRDGLWDPGDSDDD